MPWRPGSILNMEGEEFLNLQLIGLPIWHLLPQVRLRYLLYRKDRLERLDLTSYNLEKIIETIVLEK